MEAINKTELLSQLENYIERHLQEAIQTFQNLSEEILLQPSSSGGWSIAQCLDHLNSYGVYYLPLFEKGIAEHQDSSVPTFTSSLLGNLAIRSMNPATGKKKFKAQKGHIPLQALDAPKVVSEFINQQERLLLIVRKAQHKDLGKIKIPISIAKFLKLNLGDALHFLIIHNERHIQQANRSLK